MFDIAVYTRYTPNTPRITARAAVLLNRGASGRDFILRYVEGEIFPPAADICRPITSPVFPAPYVFPK